MQKEDLIIELLKGISERLTRVEERQDSDKKEMLSLISENKKEIQQNKKEILDRITSFENNINLHLTTISNTLAYEKLD